jgi:uncharacterized membrane protein
MAGWVAGRMKVVVILTVATGWNAPKADHRAMTIAVSANETVTCTFINTKRGTIIVRKATVGTTGTFTFSGSQFLVLGGSILAYLLWFHLLKVCGATAASAYHFLMPPLGMLFAFLVLGEHVEFRDLLGIVPVALGIYLVTRPAASSSTKRSAI